MPVMEVYFRPPYNLIGHGMVAFGIKLVGNASSDVAAGGGKR
jgi:hypothetical protein